MKRKMERYDNLHDELIDETQKAVEEIKRFKAEHPDPILHIAAYRWQSITESASNQFIKHLNNTGKKDPEFLKTLMDCKAMVTTSLSKEYYHLVLRFPSEESKLAFCLRVDKDALFKPYRNYPEL